MAAPWAAHTGKTSHFVRFSIKTDIESTELRDFSHTVAEIEWLLLILVLLYQVALAPDEEASAALSMYASKADGKNRTSVAWRRQNL